MIKFIIKEIASSFFSLLIFLFLMFYLINVLIPGDFLTPLRLFMRGSELNDLRESLGVNDPLYQRYFRWIISVFSGEITPGGFMQRNSKDILTTIFPTLQIVIPSFILSYSFSYLQVISSKVNKLHKNKLFSDTFSILIISIFPPVSLFIVGDKFEEISQLLFKKLEIEKSLVSSNEYTDFQFNLHLLLFLLLLVISISFFKNLLILQINKKQIIIILFLILIMLNKEKTLLSDVIIESRNALITIFLLSLFFIGEFILLNNVISQNLAREPHVLTARAIGYSKKAIFQKQIIRNSLGPFTTKLALNLPFTIASLVIVESTTGWNGMGSLLYKTIMNQDSYAAMGIFLLLALLTIFLRLSISILHALVEPRINLK